MGSLGMNKGDDDFQYFQAAQRLIRKLEDREDPSKVENEVRRVRNVGLSGPINGRKDVQEALHRAEEWLQSQQR